MQNFDQMKSLLQTALKKADVDYCEVRFENSRELLILFSGVTLERVDNETLYGGNVRALHKGGWGFASFNNLDDLDANIKLACDQAKAAGEIVNEEGFKLAPVPVVEKDFCPTWTLHPEAVSLKEKIRILGHYHKLILSYEGIPSARAYHLERCTTLYFANSEGTFTKQEKVDFSGALAAQGRKGDLSLTQSVTYGSSLGIEGFLGLDNQVHEMCERTLKLLDAEPIKAGVYTVICDPDHTGIFVHEAFGHVSEADSLYKDEGFLASMPLGRVLGKPILNIYETGEIFSSRGALAYDDEGVESKNVDLIKDGKLVGRMYDRWSAAKLASEGAVPTGSGRAINYQHPPIVRMRNTCIGAGDSTFEEMIKDIKLGLYAVGGGGGGQTNGEMFNFGADYGIMIRDGKLAEMVRDVTLTGNVFTTLENIDMVGNDQTASDGPGGCGKNWQGGLPVSTKCPHIRIQNVVVGGVK